MGNDNCRRFSVKGREKRGGENNGEKERERERL